MNEQEYLAGVIRQQVDGGRAAVLISLMSLEGSSPRHDGTKMAVGGDGQAYGTIGGSLIEAAAVREARTILETGRSRIFPFELDGKSTESPGMICGGRAEVMLDYIAPTPANQAFCRAWQEALRRGTDFYLLTHFSGGQKGLNVLGHAILLPDCTLAATTSVTESEAAGLKAELHNVSATTVLPLGGASVMVDRVRKLKTVYCFGAGHVAVPTAHLAALTGFRVIVLDDRPEFANKARFPEAHEVRVLADFNRPLDGLDIDRDAYVVIVTRGHMFDRIVLEQSLRTEAGYIGMISSRRKREAIFNALMETGVSKERLDWVHSPIGLEIGGETPEEIAVSIVAELIQVRSKPGA